MIQLPFILPSGLLSLLPAQLRDYGRSTDMVHNAKERPLLCALARLYQPRTVIELGCFRGETANALLNACPSIEQYIGCDTVRVNETQDHAKWFQFEHGDKINSANRGRFALALRRTKYETYNWPQGMDDRADLIYVDGDHSYAGCMADSLIALQLIAPGGVIVWHDYVPYWVQCVKACIGGKVDFEGRFRVDEVLHELRKAGHDIRWVFGTSLAVGLNIGRERKL